ncbi:EF2563 family selenium-dependent molybdenum hydroxylase system protein [Heliobacterium chlorum]|uniref:EF2563 family selenium-dependent molybdenum hydroxylase system protein n=1 Tax=Heliobacterium chlorum TaxID=2698 RepID=A0ABR7SYU3_HELCL|nr:selenium-dependent molybdenum cofactor biosynthesis protein YqeB [Heliobacterium chlorum]MBC9783703.1 EF2563 family selenium-dependent molybdenum hydroxylase system protein [Heliobacterium chlorum]
MERLRIVIKGAGDLASGVAHRLYRSGFVPVMTELEHPLVVRRTVSFAEAIYSGEATVEGVTAKRVMNLEEAMEYRRKRIIPVLPDVSGQVILEMRPHVLIDATVAKENLGTSIDDAPVVIALGPGFYAGKDVHAVVETKRGHYLGRVIWEGPAIANTGIPGEIGGFSHERLLRAPVDGTFTAVKAIGDLVKAGDIVGNVGGHPVESTIPGMLRGLIKDGITVTSGMKIGDVDPRADRDSCFTISDKARAVAGGVLEAMLAASKNYGNWGIDIV